MNLESRFYTDVSKYEPEVMLGMTKRQLKMVALSNFNGVGNGSPS